MELHLLMCSPILLQGKKDLCELYNVSVVTIHFIFLGRFSPVTRHQHLILVNYVKFSVYNGTSFFVFTSAFSDLEICLFNYLKTIVGIGVSAVVVAAALFSAPVFWHPIKRAKPHTQAGMLFGKVLGTHS